MKRQAGHWGREEVVTSKRAEGLWHSAVQEGGGFIWENAVAGCLEACWASLGISLSGYAQTYPAITQAGKPPNCAESHASGRNCV